jgi:Leucine-rich repeat (LRR) protein
LRVSQIRHTLIARTDILTLFVHNHRDAAAFLVKDSVTKTARDEGTLRDHYGVPTDRDEIAKRPRVGEDGVFLLSSGGKKMPISDDTVSIDGTDSSRGSDSGACAAGDYRYHAQHAGGSENFKKETSVPSDEHSARPSWGFLGVDTTDVAFDPIPNGNEHPDLVEEIRRVERVVLSDLFRSTEGSRWVRQKNWLSRKTHCDWEGVFCASKESIAGVLALRLGDNKLNGVLPQTLARLHRLRYLDVSHNHLRGEIHGAFGSLKGLREFNVRSNFLRGEIPEELGALAFLEKLDVSGNLLAGEIPLSLGTRLKNLRLFNCSGNGLSGSLPVQLASVRSLEVFSCSRNKFSDGLVSAAAAAATTENSKLIIFDVSENALTGSVPLLPEQAQALAIWDISSNSLSGQFPDNFTTNANLKVFSVANNGNLTGALPASLFPYDSQLRLVDVSSCGLTGFLPDTLMALRHVRSLNVSFNKFGGPIPNEGAVDVRKMNRLSTFDASHNSLNGTLPASLLALKTLVVLDVGGNRLSGPIPGEQLMNLAKATKLNFRGNTFSGPLPPELCLLKELRWLDLANNQFAVSISHSPHSTD